MKKLIVIAAAFVLTLSSGTTAFAAGHGHSQYHSAGSTANAGYCTFVDANGDGICDNGDTHCTFTDANGDGICDNGDTHCSGYLDADNNGICDNCQNTNEHSGTACASGYTHASTGGHRTGRHGGGHH